MPATGREQPPPPLDELTYFQRMAPELFRDLFLRRSGRADTGEALLPRGEVFLRMFQENATAMFAYAPRPYPRRLLFFLAREMATGVKARLMSERRRMCAAPSEATKDWASGLSPTHSGCQTTRKPSEEKILVQGVGVSQVLLGHQIRSECHRAHPVWDGGADEEFSCGTVTLPSTSHGTP